MSTFKHHKTSADRSASDRRRHKKKIEKAIREGVYDIVAEESIIGQDGKKKIRIPVRGIKEYRFIFGDNQSNSKVGSAKDKDVTRGQSIGEAPKEKQPGSEAGTEAGEEYYEVEITLEELAEYLFADLELPELEKKRLKKITSESFKRHGYRNKGIRPRLDKKKTAINRIKRKKKSSLDNLKHDNDDNSEERFSFHNNDLRYKHIKQTQKESNNAAIFFIMDISGSMTKEKKFLARSFYFLLYQFLRHRYEAIEIIFVAHDTQSYEVNEQQFFTRGAGGGTLVSSALQHTHEIITQRYHPNSWNLYCFQCSDGDNWENDTSICNQAVMTLKQICQLYCYCEIEPERERIEWQGQRESRLSNAFSSFVDRRFKIVKIFDKLDIWPAFRKVFGGKSDG
ncbi:sporulation protein YhbH [archaeon]|nr:sporulation protein YhbH [archaeon]